MAKKIQIMAAPKNNQFWRLADPETIGRPKNYETAVELWKAACEYFEWCDQNSLKDERVFHYQGEIKTHHVNKLRPYTIKGLCMFLGVNERYLSQVDDIEFSTVIEYLKDIIYDQKFTGAVVGFFNANIIARDLGLKESTEVATNEIKCRTRQPA